MMHGQKNIKLWFLQFGYKYFLVWSYIFFRCGIRGIEICA